MGEGSKITLLDASQGAGLQEKLDSLPSSPGVYQFRNADGKILYVGKASSLRNRVRQYFHRSRAQEPRIDAMVAQIVDVETIVTDSETEALILESNLIKKLKPRYNVVLKDDKSYPFIVITNEPFPRVFVTRRRIRGRGRYFGPYTDVKTMRSALKTVRDLFMVRSCNYDLTEDSIARGRFKVCLDYHIHKCEGPCEAKVSREQYAAMIEHVARVLRGRTKEVRQELEQEMNRLSEAMKYEDAAAVRDRIKALAVYEEKQKMHGATEADRDVVELAVIGDDACAVCFSIREGKLIGSRNVFASQASNVERGEVLEAMLERFYEEEDDIPPTVSLSVALPEGSLVPGWLAERAGKAVMLGNSPGGDIARLHVLARKNAELLLNDLSLQRLKRGETVPGVVEALRRDLRLAAPPRRIECFDISNTQGTDSVASMVVFMDGKPRRSEYRTFRIRTVTGADDFASMKEVVTRRYERALREKLPLPDLVVVDGGKGQLSSAKEALNAAGADALPSIGLAKKLEEVFFPGESEPLQLPRTSASLRLLQRIRDEAHRFAVTYHRKLRTRRLLRTELDLIKGIGRTRAKELLEAFGSVQGVRFATDEQLADVVGERLAETIRTYFTSDESASPDGASGTPESGPSGTTEDL